MAPGHCWKPLDLHEIIDLSKKKNLNLLLDIHRLVACRDIQSDFADVHREMLRDSWYHVTHTTHFPICSIVYMYIWGSR